MLLIRAFLKALGVCILVGGGFTGLFIGLDALTKWNSWTFPALLVLGIVGCLTYINYWELKTHSPNKR